MSKDLQDSFDAYQDSVNAPTEDDNNEAAARDDGEDLESDENAVKFAVLKVVCIKLEESSRL